MWLDASLLLICIISLLIGIFSTLTARYVGRRVAWEATYAENPRLSRAVLLVLVLVWPVTQGLLLIKLNGVHVVTSALFALGVLALEIIVALLSRWQYFRRPS